MKRIKTLIVDDSAHFREVLKVILDKDPSIDVIGLLNSGEDCLKFVRKHKVDLVMMDARLPGLDGPQTIRKLKKQCPNIKTIICTVWPENEAKIYSKEAGAEGYFVKGEAVRILLKKIHSIFSC